MTRILVLLLLLLVAGAQHAPGTYDRERLAVMSKPRAEKRPLIAPTKEQMYEARWIGDDDELKAALSSGISQAELDSILAYNHSEFVRRTTEPLPAAKEQPDSACIHFWQAHSATQAQIVVVRPDQIRRFYP